MEEKFFENEEEAKKYKRIQIAKDIVLYLILTFFALFTLIPFLWMLTTSFKSTQEIQDMTVSQTFFPKTWQDNYSAFFNPESTYFKLWRYMGNTILVGAITTVLEVVVTVLAAFAFARLSFKGKELIFSLLLGTMMIPGEMMIITNYTTVSYLQWNVGTWTTYLALIVPFITSVFYTFYLRQNFRQIPNELYYAAKVDGVSDFKYLWKVMIPIAKPAITTVTILSMIGSWNAYIWPRTVTPQGLNTAGSEYNLVTSGIMQMFATDISSSTNLGNYKMAAMVLVSLPLLIAFIVFKKYIMNGVSRSGIKG